MNVLVIAAHPDDETIGAGGTIRSLTSRGHKVYIWIATEVYEPQWPAKERRLRQSEARKAAKILGAKDVLFGGFPTMNLSTIPAFELSSAVSEVVSNVQPALLLAPAPGDVNSDHNAVFDAALVAARGLPGNPIRAFYAYEISTTTRFCGPSGAFAPNTYVDISKTFARKLRAFAAYKSEKREFPHPRSAEGLESIARERGLGCGAKYAECFMLISRRFHDGEAPLV